MTTSRCFARVAPALSLPHDIISDSPSRPHPWHRSGPAPHRLGRDRDRRQPADLRRLRLGGTARRPPPGKPPVGNPDSPPPRAPPFHARATPRPPTPLTQD